MNYLSQALALLLGLLLDAAAALFVLRLLAEAARADFHNPFSQFVYRYSNPVLAPRRRMLPNWRRINLAALLVTYLILLIKRLALLALAGVLASRPRLAFAMAGCALAMQPLLGHPAQAGAVPALAEAVHVLAAGLWLGGLPALFLALRRLPAAAHPALLRRFGRLGYGAVLAIALSGLLQAVFLLGAWQRLWSTEYGHAMVVKTVLFALALVLAAENRFLHLPRLEAGRRAGKQTQRQLAASLAQEALLGLLLILAAAWLASLPPGAG
jgi:putative copper export protein